MRTRLSCIFLVILLCALTSMSGAEIRTWTDDTGQYTVEAELVEVRDGIVFLRKTDGSVSPVPLDRLSEADRQYIAGDGESDRGCR